MFVFKHKQAKSSQEATKKYINTQRKCDNQQQHQGGEDDDNYHKEHIWQHQTCPFSNNKHYQRKRYQNLQIITTGRTLYPPNVLTSKIKGKEASNI